MTNSDNLFSPKHKDDDHKRQIIILITDKWHQLSISSKVHQCLVKLTFIIHTLKCIKST